jgi:ubiquinone/menaquinone biosynthesis C-methylase UbiE
MSSESVRELYDRTATGWVRNQPLSLSDFTGRPPVLALCEPVEKMRVLDLGCGEGYCARKLARSGAGSVKACDISPAMIEAARAEEAREPLGISYSVGDATDLAAFADGEFDRVLCMFLFNYVTVEATHACFAQVYRVLAERGRFVFAVPHPQLPWLRPKEPPFYFDPAAGGYFSARNQRFAGRIWKRDGSALEVQACHKTFEDYFSGLRAAGFAAMPAVRELHVTPEILAVDPQFFGPLVDIPLHLAVAVQK